MGSSTFRVYLLTCDPPSLCHEHGSERHHGTHHPGTQTVVSHGSSNSFICLNGDLGDSCYVRVTGYDDCNDVVREVQTGSHTWKRIKRMTGTLATFLLSTYVTSPFVTVTVCGIFVDIKNKSVYSN